MQRRPSILRKALPVDGWEQCASQLNRFESKAISLAKNASGGSGSGSGISD